MQWGIQLTTKAWICHWTQMSLPRWQPLALFAVCSWGCSVPRLPTRRKLAEVGCAGTDLFFRTFTHCSTNWQMTVMPSTLQCVRSQPKAFSHRQLANCSSAHSPQGSLTQKAPQCWHLRKSQAHPSAIPTVPPLTVLHILWFASWYLAVWAENTMQEWSTVWGNSGFTRPTYCFYQNPTCL